MIDRIVLLAGISSIVIIIVAFDLTRRKMLDEKSALRWIAVGLGILVLSIWRDLLFTITHISGAGEPYVIVMLASIIFFILTMITFDLRQSKQKKQIRALSQKVALLEAKSRKKKIILK